MAKNWPFSYFQRRGLCKFGKVSLLRITNTPEQERSVSFSPDGKPRYIRRSEAIVGRFTKHASAAKKSLIFILLRVLKETALIANDNENYQPSYSPDGKEVAFLKPRYTQNLESRY
ncbi:MAG: hypothetical protein R2822_29495 [Spirosomataceae bacterium]